MCNMIIGTKKISEDKQDSFWYYGKTIGSVKLKNGNTLYGESRGEIKVSFGEDQPSYSGDEAVKMAESLNLNDAGLDALSGHDGFSLANWFSFTEVDENDEVIDGDWNIYSSYDEVITFLSDIESGKK